MRSTKGKKSEELLPIKKREKVKDSSPNIADSPIKDSDVLSLKALSFHFQDKKRVSRALFLKHDPTNQCSLSLANVPPFLSKDDVESLLAKAIEDCFDNEASEFSERVPKVIFKKTNAVDKNISAGYRSGSVIFQSPDHAKCLLNKCESLSSISLEKIGVHRCAQFGLAKYVSEYNDRFVPVDKLLKSVNEVVAAYDDRKAAEEEEIKRNTKQPDEDGWVTVTKNDKLSFRGKINGKRAIEFADEDYLLNVNNKSNERLKKSKQSVL